MFQEIIRSERIDIHIPTHRHQLGSGQIIERNIVLELFSDFNDVLWGRGFTRASDFSEEFFEFLRVDDSFGFEAGFGDGLLQELGHLDSYTEKTSLFLVLDAGCQLLD